MIAIAGGIAMTSGFLAKKIGFELTPDQQGTLVVLSFGLVASLSNFLKHKFPKVFGWM